MKVFAFFSDEAYENAGATLISDAWAIWQEADIVLKVTPPSEDEIERLKAGTVLISFLDPLRNPERIKQLAERQVTAFSMELIPRTRHSGNIVIIKCKVRPKSLSGVCFDDRLLVTKKVQFAE